MDRTPDSWENGPSQKLSGLSIGAKPFVPNVNASSFVPGGSFVPMAKPAPAPLPEPEEIVANGEGLLLTANFSISHFILEDIFHSALS